MTSLMSCLLSSVVVILYLFAAMKYPSPNHETSAYSTKWNPGS
jgi:hypothetical protein